MIFIFCKEDVRLSDTNNYYERTYQYNFCKRKKSTKCIYIFLFMINYISKGHCTIMVP